MHARAISFRPFFHNHRPMVQPPSPPPTDGGPARLSLGAPRGKRGSKDVHASGVAGRPPFSASAQQRADAAVRSTDNDAMGSRLSAALQGYLPLDAFTQTLASGEASSSATLARRSPIINIGTYLRCSAIDELVDRFLRDGTTKGKQIVSVGAGSDSRFWRLRSNRSLSSSVRHYVELDFAQLTTSKVERITRHQHLMELVKGEDGSEADISPDRACLQTSLYSLIACDLRTLTKDERVQRMLQRNLDPTLDTLIIAECVLAYLSPTSSDDLLAFFGGMLQRPCGICYEMCVAGAVEATRLSAEPSRFGTVMLSNLEARNLLMPGARAYSTPASHARRFEKAFGSTTRHENGRGFALTLSEVWHGQSESERARLSRLEGLDEVEELDILLSHYAISWYAYDVNAFVHFAKPTL